MHFEHRDMAAAACSFAVAAALPPAKRQRRSGGLCRALAQQTTSADVVVVGAGAAGLAAAHFAAVSGARVRVLEKMDEAGKKICISGGTRCNVLPAEVDLQVRQLGCWRVPAGSAAAAPPLDVRGACLLVVLPLPCC